MDVPALQPASFVLARGPSDAVARDSGHTNGCGEVHAGECYLAKARLCWRALEDEVRVDRSAGGLAGNELHRAGRDRAADGSLS